jgi:hypothetical protein
MSTHIQSRHKDLYDVQHKHHSWLECSQKLRWVGIVLIILLVIALIVLFVTMKVIGYGIWASGSGSGGMGLIPSYLPLLTNYNNDADPSDTPTILGNSQCANFTAAGWTQACNVNQSPATLSLTYPPESGHFTLCVAGYLTAYSGTSTSHFFSCQQLSGAGSTECGTLYYTGGELVATLNSFTVTPVQFFYIVTLALRTWFHTCLSYQNNTQLMTLYYNGNNVANGTVPRASSLYGTPMLGGDGNFAQTHPTIGSFQNWRSYATVLSDADVEGVALVDTP